MCDNVSKSTKSLIPYKETKMNVIFAISCVPTIKFKIVDVILLELTFSLWLLSYFIPGIIMYHLLWRSFLLLHFRLFLPPHAPLDCKLCDWNIAVLPEKLF